MSNELVLPILHTYEYKHIPMELSLHLNDESLHSSYMLEEDTKVSIPSHLCVGIGTYKTNKDGPIYLCTLLDSKTGKVCGYSIGVYRSAELVGRAVEVLLGSYLSSNTSITIRSSQNSIYKTNRYHELMAKYPVQLEMTIPGTRGGVAVVSTFFSQLMRRKGDYAFVSWQDAIDWLEWYIECNRKKGNIH